MERRWGQQTLNSRTTTREENQHGGLSARASGRVLPTEFLEPLRISTYRLVKAIDVPQTRLSEILRGRRAITADTGLRFRVAHRVMPIWEALARRGRYRGSTPSIHGGNQFVPAADLFRELHDALPDDAICVDEVALGRVARH